MCAAIAPNEEELKNCTPESMNKWEYNRSKELYVIIHDLLQIAKKKNMG